MSVRVAINGFGRTGRATVRAAHEQGADIEWVALNDVMGAESVARLLRTDSVYGRSPAWSRPARDASRSTASGSVSTPSPTPRRSRGRPWESTWVKVIAWYDNEWGYSSRLVELAQRVAVPIAATA